MVEELLEPDGQVLAVAALAEVVGLVVVFQQPGGLAQAAQAHEHLDALVPRNGTVVVIVHDKHRSGDVLSMEDGGVLDIEFKVTGFEAVFFDNMGNAVPIVSEGASFSGRQMDTFRKLSRSKRFYISKVKAIGPDGILRTLPTSMEVIIK